MSASPDAVVAPPPTPDVLRARDRLGDDIRYAFQALRSSRAYAAAVVAAVALGSGVAFPVLSLRHRHTGLLPRGGADPSLLLQGRLPAGWGTRLETTAQHAGVLASRDILFAFAGLAVAMACASIGALVLARAAAARRHVAVRAAVGADPGAVLWEAALEAALVAAVAVLSLGMVAIGVHAALATLSPELIRSWLVNRPGVDSVLDGLAPSLLALLLFAPLAALPAATWSLMAALGAARTTSRPEEGSLRQAIAIVQLTAALSLLIAAGLLLSNGRAPRTGGPPMAALETAGTTRIWTVAAPPAAGAGPDLAAWNANLLERVRRLPGVVAATIAPPGAWVGGGAEGGAMFTCPLCGNGGFPTPVVATRLSLQLVGPAFFSTLGVPVRGREITAGNAGDTAHVAVINRSFEALFQGVVDPIGQQARVLATGEWYRIVGVVPDVRAPGVGAGLGEPATIYLPLLRYPARTVELLVRPGAARAPPAVATALARDGLGSALPNGSLGAALDRLAAPLRWFGQASLALAAVLLLLAIHGVAVVAVDEVRRRRRELAVRSALGATPLRLAALVLRRALGRLILAVCFTAEGVAIVRWLLQRMSPVAHVWDLSVYVFALTTVAAVALLATAGAVRAAFRFEPHTALSDDR